MLSHWHDWHFDEWRLLITPLTEVCSVETGGFEKWSLTGTHTHEFDTRKQMVSPLKRAHSDDNKSHNFYILNRRFSMHFGMLCCVNHIFFTSHSTPSGRLMSNSRTSSGIILRIST